MQLDSHRCQNSLLSRINSEPQPTATPVFAPAPSLTPAAAAPQMPCSRSQRCGKPKTYIAEDGTEMLAWHSIRRDQLRNMRKMVKRVVLYMALIEALRVGPAAFVFAGKKGYAEPGPEDFGIVYYAGYILSYIFLCVFTIVWDPLFSWWVTTTPEESTGENKVDKMATISMQINMVILPLSVALSLGQYLFWMITTFVYVDARPVSNFATPKNTRKNWLARAMLLAGVLASTGFGYRVFQVLAEYDLAHVKHLEYMIIVVPVQINLGILLGSAMQYRMEKRLERKELAAKMSLSIGTYDEKQVLIDV